MTLRAELRLHRGEMRAANARRSWTERAGALVTLEAEGVRGVGEASPLPGYSPDTLEGARATLEGVLGALDEQLVLEGPLRPALEAVGRLVDVHAQPSAAFALETAVLDLWSQRRGMPAWRALAEAFDRAPVARLPLASLVRLDAGPATAREHAARAVDAGFQTLKGKIGRDLAAELESAAAVREAYPEVALRFDANGTLPPPRATAVLTALAGLRAELVEEPVGHTALLEGAPFPVPVALDESLQGPEGAQRLERLADAAKVQAVVLKPMALGGFVRAFALAERRTLPSVVSHCFDGPIAWAASGALALALGGEHAAGLGAHAGLGAWPAWAAPAFEGATLHAMDAPGLGVEGA
ncbi:MAG: enolase C-terminal domain-like protein [Myxococcota bacterium]